MIQGSEVAIVDSFKFLRILISSDLTWEVYFGHCVKKAQQRIFFVRRSHSFGLSHCVMLLFYRAVIESISTLPITVRYGNATQEDCRNLNRVVNMASKVIGVE